MKLTENLRCSIWIWKTYLEGWLTQRCKGRQGSVRARGNLSGLYCCHKNLHSPFIPSYFHHPKPSFQICHVYYIRRSRWLGNLRFLHHCIPMYACACCVGPHGRLMHQFGSSPSGLGNYQHHCQCFYSDSTNAYGLVSQYASAKKNCCMWNLCYWQRVSLHKWGWILIRLIHYAIRLTN